MSEQTAAPLCREEIRSRLEKMLCLREELLAVEEDRLAGRNGVTPEELDDYLDAVIAETGERRS